MKIRNSVQVCVWNSVKIRTLFHSQYIFVLDGRLNSWYLSYFFFISAEDAIDLFMVGTAFDLFFWCCYVDILM